MARPPLGLAAQRSMPVSERRPWIENGAVSRSGETPWNEQVARSPPVSAASFCEQGGGEGVHDEPVIALDIARIATVVVDPVAVEGERRITEEQDLLGVTVSLTSASVGAGSGCRFGVSTSGSSR